MRASQKGFDLTPRIIRARTAKPASSVRKLPQVDKFLKKHKDPWLTRKLNSVIDELKGDVGAGEPLPPKIWPSSYLRKWGLTNLHKMDVGPDCRIMYTLLYDGAGVAVVVLEVLSHNGYDRLFGYRTT